MLYDAETNSEGSERIRATLSGLRLGKPYHGLSKSVSDVEVYDSLNALSVLRIRNRFRIGVSRM
jgi:hypothetical protein